MKIIKTIGKIFVWSFIILVAYGVYSAMSTNSKTSTPYSTPSKETEQKAEVRKADPEMQQKRLEFIQKMGSMGLAEKIEIENGVGKFWITNKFLLLPEKEQNELLNVPFAYVVDELGKDPMFVSFTLKMDNGTPLGKRVGEYKHIYGVKFYK